MYNCKYVNIEVVDGIKHEICTNEELKELNTSNGKSIPCMNNCGKFEERTMNKTR